MAYSRPRRGAPTRADNPSAQFSNPPTSARARRAPRASLAVAPRPATARRKPWRQSLLDGSFKHVALSQREGFVRGPASAALEALLEVGKGEEGDEVALRLDERRVRQYLAFEGVKRAYLSPALFLSPASLASVHPGALADPTGPLATLITLANLTTFLYLVLSASPAPDGTRAKTAGQALLDAAHAFLSHVVPVDSPVHDGVLKMLVALKCQAYLATASRARHPPSPAPFFSSPLSAHLPDAPADSLANREASRRFGRYCAQALEQIEQTGADASVLATQWRWEDVAIELRNYCEQIATRFLGSEDGESSQSQSQSQSLGRGSSPRITGVKGKGRDDDILEESYDEDEMRREDESEMEDQMRVDEAQTGDEEEEEGYEYRDAVRRATGADDGPDSDEEDVPFQNADDDEQDLNSDTDDEDAERDRFRSASIVARSLGALSPRKGDERDEEEGENESEEEGEEEGEGESNTLRTFTAADSYNTQQRERIDELRNLRQAEGDDWDEDDEREDADEEEEEPEFEVDTQAPNNAAALRELMDANDDNKEQEQTEADQDYVVDTQAPNRAQELLDLAAELSPDEEEDDATPVPAHRDAAPAPDETARKPAMALRFQPDNTLKLVPVDERRRPGRFLDAQPDGVRIRFDDSQSQSPAPTPLNASTSSGVDQPKPRRRAKAVSGPKAINVPRRAKGDSVPAPELRRGRSHVSLDPEDALEVDELDGLSEGHGREALRKVSPVQFHLDDDYGGGGSEEDEERRRSAQERDELDEEGSDDQAVIEQPASKAKSAKAKGKQRQRSPRAPSPALPATFSHRTRPSHDSTSNQAVAGPSRATQVQTATKRPRVHPAEADDPDGFVTQSDETDDERVKQNRRRITINSDTDSDEFSRPAMRRKSTHVGSDDESPRPQSTQKKGKGAPALSRDRDSEDDSDSEGEVVPRPRRPRNLNHYFQGRNVPGGRIPWTQKEERLLMLELSKFPNAFADIILRHGDKGTISQKLRLRNPVSLKDKARNIKIGLIKAGRKVPWFLERITVKPGIQNLLQGGRRDADGLHESDSE